ncbi:MAG: hypothetical protein QG608_474 [Actinomycetota bacterium]|nr:hypothetical protein [Actinomycetota bacterium]
MQELRIHIGSNGCTAAGGPSCGDRPGDVRCGWTGPGVPGGTVCLEHPYRVVPAERKADRRGPRRASKESARRDGRPSDVGSAFDRMIRTVPFGPRGAIGQGPVASSDAATTVASRSTQCGYALASLPRRRRTREGRRIDRGRRFGTGDDVLHPAGHLTGARRHSGSAAHREFHLTTRDLGTGEGRRIRGPDSNTCPAVVSPHHSSGRGWFDPDDPLGGRSSGPGEGRPARRRGSCRGWCRAGRGVIRPVSSVPRRGA